MQDPRTDFERLPSENFYDIAGNSAAVYRKLAVEILVERASPSCRPRRDPAKAREVVLNNPVILQASQRLQLQKPSSFSREWQLQPSREGIL